MLHTPDYTGASSYCGPTAVAAITGRPARELCEWLCATYSRTYKSPTAIRSTSLGELAAFMESVGHTVTWHSVGNQTPLSPRWPQQETLTQWMRRTRAARGGRTYLVRVTGHFVAVCGDRVVDSINVERYPIPLAASKSKRKRVTHALEVA